MAICNRNSLGGLFCFGDRSARKRFPISGLSRDRRNRHDYRCGDPVHGVFSGGMIIPGLKMMAMSLARQYRSITCNFR